MGLTICYSGIMRNPEEMESFLDDVCDICLEIGWRFLPIHRSNIMPAKGIEITPEGSESIWLTFLENGRMYNPIHFLFSRHPENEIVDEEKHKWIFTKTQYAGIDTHMAIIKLFRFLNMKYFDAFEMRDQSQYWETGDESVCLIRFDEFEAGLDRIEGILIKLDEMLPEQPESEAERMDQLLLKRGGLGMSMN